MRLDRKIFTRDFSSFTGRRASRFFFFYWPRANKIPRTGARRSGSGFFSDLQFPPVKWEDFFWNNILI